MNENKICIKKIQIRMMDITFLPIAFSRNPRLLRFFTSHLVPKGVLGLCNEMLASTLKFPSVKTHFDSILQFALRILRENSLNTNYSYIMKT